MFYISDIDFQQTNLIALDGTIAVIYKGCRYNIPLTVFLPRNFPDHPPIVRVQPTQDMHINPRSQNVDVNGKVSHPILHNWQTNRNLRSLTILLNKLQEDFGKVTPVAAKPASQVQQPTPYPSYQQSNTGYPQVGGGPPGYPNQMPAYPPQQNFQNPYGLG